MLFLNRVNFLSRVFCLERESTSLIRSFQQLVSEGSLSWHDTLQVPSTSTYTLLMELQRNKDTFNCAELVAEVTGHLQEQRMQILIVNTHPFKVTVV